MIYQVEATLAAAVSALTVLTAVAYLLLGIDDVFVDVCFWTRGVIKRFRHAYPRLDLEQLRVAPQQRIAIFVPCWHEGPVIARVLAYACQRIEYENYLILVGVYPNDAETIAEVEAVQKRYPQVRPVVNPLPGPTTKGQNLNAMFRAMRELEDDDPFRIIVMHDAEDVFHPYELHIYNRLIPRKTMVQLPVFPLEIGLFKWTGWTYADEFVESHLKDLFVREMIGGFVPSAGVGCGFERTALERLGGPSGEVFPPDALTEDYLMGLRLGLRGGATVLVHQVLRERWRPARRLRAASFVATRAYFPDKLRTAIRQKRRWTIGICFQAWASAGWRGSFVTRYALYRDRKGIIGNPLVLFGYVLMLLGASIYGWHGVDDQIALPSAGTNRIVWTIYDAVVLMTLSRLIQKSYFVASMYGPLQGFLALLRVPWGGFINACATISASYAYTKARLTGQRLAWAKTAHIFPSEEALHESV